MNQKTKSLHDSLGFDLMILAGNEKTPNIHACQLPCQLIDYKHS
jgi:hypothetical protein